MLSFFRGSFWSVLRDVGWGPLARPSEAAQGSTSSRGTLECSSSCSGAVLSVFLSEIKGKNALARPSEAAQGTSSRGEAAFATFANFYHLIINVALTWQQQLSKTK